MVSVAYFTNIYKLISNYILIIELIVAVVTVSLAYNLKYLHFKKVIIQY